MNDIERKTYKMWGFTVKYNCKEGGTQDAADYSIWFSKCEKLGIQIECKYAEPDSKGIVHYHGVFYAPKSVYLKKLTMKGYHYKLVEIYDKAKWLEYCKKNQKTGETLIRSETPEGLPSPRVIVRRNLFK